MSACSLKKYISLCQVIKDRSPVMMPLSGSRKKVETEIDLMEINSGE